MYTEILFKTALNGLYGDYLKLMPRWYANKYGQAQEVDRAWKLYSNAASTQLSMLLLGDKGIRDAKEMLTNFGTTAVYPVSTPKGSMAKSIPALDAQGKPTRVGASNRTGSILNEEDWWPLPNDAWTMGGVHSLTPFYMVMPTLPPDDLVWETKFGGRPRVLGRELIGLFTFGYKRISHASESSVGIVLAPVDKAKATGATFKAYLTAATKYKKAADIKSGFDDKASVAYDDYTKPTL